MTCAPDILLIVLKYIQAYSEILSIRERLKLTVTCLTGNLCIMAVDLLNLHHQLNCFCCKSLYRQRSVCHVLTSVHQQNNTTFMIFRDIQLSIKIKRIIYSACISHELENLTNESHQTKNVLGSNLKELHNFSHLFFIYFFIPALYK